VIQARQEDLPMSDQFWLTKAQLTRIEPFFPRTRGVPRVDDRRVVSGIVCNPKWSEIAGCARGLWPPHDALESVPSLVSYGVIDRIFANLAAESGPPDRVMIDSTNLKSHLTAASLLKKGDSPRLIGRTKGGLNSKLHVVRDGVGRPVTFLLTEGQMSDHKGAALIYPMLPEAETLIADKSYDSDAFREALAGRGITPCIPPRAKRRLPAT
jgi:transposase